VNIFFLHIHPSLAARYQCDKHVVKMILESAQLLSTCHHVYGTATPLMYKATHINHPSARWVRESKTNYRWLIQHFDALCQEYTYRYGKTHKSQSLLSCLSDNPESQPEHGLTKPPLAMPDQYKNDASVVASYRRYYALGKADLLTYTRRPQPAWIKEIQNAEAQARI